MLIEIIIFTCLYIFLCNVRLKKLNFCSFLQIHKNLQKAIIINIIYIFYIVFFTLYIYLIKKEN